MEIVADSSFQALVNVLRAANKAHRAHAVATVGHCLHGTVDELAIIAQSQIIVGAKIEHFLPRFHFNISLLRRGDNSLFLIKAGFFNVGKFLIQKCFNVTVHGSKQLVVK